MTVRELILHLSKASPDKEVKIQLDRFWSDISKIEETRFTLFICESETEKFSDSEKVIYTDAPIEITTSEPKEFNVYWNKSQNQKFVVAKVMLEEIKNHPDQYEYVCETPHADGDYSYLCYSTDCRCRS